MRTPVHSNGSRANGGSEVLGTLNRPVLLGDVLHFHRCPRPSLPIREDREPGSPDACLYPTPPQVKPYRLTGETGWASFEELRSRFLETGETVPIRYETVFAPVKVVLSIRKDGIRSTVAYEPVYPLEGWLGTLVPGRHLWFAYVAVAVLNTRSTSAAEGDENNTSLIRPGTLALDHLLRLPLLPAGVGEVHMTEVAHLCHQLTALYDAELECGRSFPRQVGATDARLQHAVAGLMEGPGQESRSRPPVVRLLEPEGAGRPEHETLLEFWEDSINEGLPENLQLVEYGAEIAA
jgi:hypothetical protein